MKFMGYISENREKYFSPEAGGLSSTEAAYVNCRLKDGRVTPRSGLRGGLEKTVYRSDFSPYTENELRLTDCYLFVDGRYCRVAVATADDLMDSIVFNMRLLFVDGEVQEIGSVTFNRVTPEQFGHPSDFTVFSGRPVKGCGIFFIVRQVYGNAIEDFVRVMELDSDMTEWIPISNSEMYVPVLLANGRGEAYYMACPFGERLQLPSPVRPESRNLLNGRFLAYFTADSASTGFFLPLENIDGGRIVGEFEEDGQKTRWIIPEGEENSETVKLDGQDFIMLCDRSIGRVYFKDPDGMDIPLPYTGKINNFRVEASKESLQDKLRVASCNACIRVEGESGLSDGGINAFYGSFVYPDEVVFSSPVHPLYFPESFCHSLGNDRIRVKKLINRGRTLLAFKDDRVYAATVEAFSVDPAVAVLSSGIALSVTDFSAHFKTVAELPVPVLPETVAKLGDMVIGVSVSGEIFALYGQGTANYRVERLGRVSASPALFGMTVGEEYLCFNEKSATVISIRGGKPSFGRWSFPASLTSGFSYSEAAVCFSRIYSGGVSIIYPLSFEGEKDRFVDIRGSLAEDRESEVKAAYSFSPFKESCHGVKLIRMRVDGSGDDLRISVKGEEGQPLCIKTQFTRGKAAVVCGKTMLHPRVTVGFVRGELSGVAVEYSRLDKV